MLDQMRKRKAGTAVLAGVAALALGACGGGGGSGGGGGASGGGGGANKPVTGVKFLVPNDPGSGYDVTARTLAKAAEEAKAARNIQVTNRSGAGGTVGLASAVNQKGNGDLAMMMGLGVVGSVFTNKSKATLEDMTPIARLIQEPDIVVVAKDSPYKTIDDLVADWKKSPAKFPVGSGSSPGGPDHLATMLTAKAAGIEPKQVNHVSFDGGGELMPAILGGEVKAGFTGIGESEEQVEAGEIRVLGVTSAEKVTGLDAPTLKESGVDVELVNWRGLVAPPEISDADRQALIGMVEKTVASPQWKAALEKNGWIDAYMPGEEFGGFITSENKRVGEVLAELGLTS
jgi:putative tricarboxylic transport membrane protein